MPRSTGCPRATSSRPEKTAERARDKEARKRQLAGAVRPLPGDPRASSTTSVAGVNGRPGEPASFDRLHELIEAQAYRLAHWRVASDDINYRRFFDINDLAALRMESPAVFEDTHRLVLELLAERQGRRPAHRPSRRAVRSAAVLRAAADAGASGNVRAGRMRQAAGGSVYIALEKILAEHERLPEHWPVHGTTGYRFMNVVNGLFVDGAAETRMDRIYAAFIGQRMNYDELLQPHQDTHHDHGAGERAERARQHPESHRQGRPPQPRFHAEQPAAGAGRDRRVVSGLPHLRDRGRGAQRGPPLHRLGGGARAESAARSRTPACSTSYAPS